MNPELTPCFDKCEAAFDKWEASFDALCRYLLDTASGRVTAAAAANSGTTEFVLASAGLAEPPAPVPLIVASPVVAPAIPIDASAMVPASCSMECAAQTATESTPALTSAAAPTSPTTTLVDVPMLAATAASEGTLDSDTTTTPLLQASGSSSSHASSKPRPRPWPSFVVLPGCVHLPEPRPTLQESSQSLMIFNGCSPCPPTALDLNQCKSSTQRPIPWPSFAGLLGGMQLAEPWPLLQGKSGEFFIVDVMYCFPYGLFWISNLPMCTQCEHQLSCSWSLPIKDVLMLRKFVAHSSGTAVADCLTAITLVIAVATMNQTSRVAIVPGTVVQEEQFTHLCANLNVLENFLKKPWAEWEEAIWSGFISTATRAFKLWCIPWFRLLFLERTSEEVFQLFSEDNHQAVQHLNDSVHLFSFALCQWEIAWQLEESENYATDNLTLYGKEVLIPWSLPNICNTSAPQSDNETMHSELVCYSQVSEGKQVLDMQLMRLFDIAVLSGYGTLVYETVITESRQLKVLYYYQAPKYHPVAVLELQGSMHSLFSGGTGPTRKIQNYMTISYSDNCQVGMYFKVRHLFYPVVQHTTQAASRSGAAAQHLRIQWDPGGAFQTWLVSWTVYVFGISTGCRQAPFQGGRNVIRAAFSDQVHVSHNYYYLDQAYYFDIVDTDLIYYSENNCGDPNKTKEVRMPWDPGKVRPSISAEASAWGQAEFQGGRDVRTLALPSSRWAGNMGSQGKARPRSQPASSHRLQVSKEKERKGYPDGSDGNGGGESSSHLGS